MVRAFWPGQVETQHLLSGTRPRALLSPTKPLLTAGPQPWGLQTWVCWSALHCRLPWHILQGLMMTHATTIILLAWQAVHRLLAALIQAGAQCPPPGRKSCLGPRLAALPL